MRIRSSAVPVLLALSALQPGVARAQKLDNDDKKFLNDVRPLLTPEEENTFKKLKEKADRTEFQKIFWARRDPDLATPANETKEQYEKDKATADQTYRVPGTLGSNTDCGRVFILLGKPDDVQTDATMSTGVRNPETWIYKDKPGRIIQGGAQIAFDPDCRGTVSLSTQLDRIAAAKVANPNIDYRLGKNGRLTPLADLLPKDTAARQLFKQPRQEFKIAFQPAFLKVADGGTALLVLVQGETAALAVTEAAGSKAVNVSLAASAVTADGQESGWIEQTMNAPVGPDGKFLGSVKMGLRPGKYTLRVGAVDVKGGKAALTEAPIEVPSYSQVQTGADGTTKPLLSGTVLVLRGIQEGGGEDPSDPFNAYRLSAAQLIPVFASELRKTDTVSFFFQVYDLQTDAAGKANGTARLKVMAEGKGLITGSGETPIDTPVFGTEIGPVPLEKFAPGKYTARLEATDKTSQKTITVDAPFEILP
jgi:GWxTD domain-containing protein